MEAIGPYRILDGPFRGGFGEVYKVYDGSSGDEFALKTLSGAFLATSDRLARFRQEIAVWIELPVHPNVVRAIKALEHRDRPWVVIEWISGGDLRAQLAHPRSSVQVLETMRQICDGMSHIHQQGVVHGDLKPSNVMMWSGTSPQITDFGFARAVGAAELSAIGGTACYLAPEAYRGIPGVSIDIYAAGVTFLEMLAATSGFGVEEARALAEEMTRADPAARPSSFALAHRRLSELIERAPIPPSQFKRGADRRTWEEEHVHAVPALAAIDEAHSLHAAGRNAEAGARLEALIEKEPTSLEAHLLLAQLRFQGEDREACARAARAARALAGDRPEELATIGLILALIDHFDEAEDVAAQLGESAGALKLRGAIAQRRGALSDAIGFFERAQAADGDRDVGLSLAQALIEAGLVERAIEELERIGRDHREHGVKVRFQLARIYVNTERHDEAANELREALRGDLGPIERAYAYGELGYLYREQGLYDAAIASYEKGLKLDRSSRVLDDGLRLCLAAKGEAPPAIRGDDSELDLRAIYAKLSELELRFENDRFLDIAEGIQRVGWRLLLEPLIIPRMLATQRISAAEAQLLQRARSRPRSEPERDADGVEVYADVYELLLTKRTLLEMFDVRAFRGHRDHRFPLVPPLLRVGHGELPQHLERTCTFVQRLASLDRYREGAAQGDAESMLGLMALAQSCGLPTALLEFTGDVRVAASVATVDGRLGEIGEVVVLRPADLEPFANLPDNPYGCVMSAPATPGLERMKSVFLESMTPSVWHDPDSTFVERYRFRQDGRPFPAVGGYGVDQLLEGVRALRAEAKSVAEAAPLPRALAEQIDAYARWLRATEIDCGSRASRADYARACSVLARARLGAASSAADRAVAAAYCAIQCELHERGLGAPNASHAVGVRHALEAHLGAEGELEERFEEGVRAAWRSWMRDREDELSGIVGRAIEGRFSAGCFEAGSDAGPGMLRILARVARGGLDSRVGWFRKVARLEGADRVERGPTTIGRGPARLRS